MDKRNEEGIKLMKDLYCDNGDSKISDAEVNEAFESLKEYFEILVRWDREYEQKKIAEMLTK